MNLVDEAEALFKRLYALPRSPRVKRLIKKANARLWRRFQAYIRPGEATRR